MIEGNIVDKDLAIQMFGTIYRYREILIKQMRDMLVKELKSLNSKDVVIPLWIENTEKLEKIFEEYRQKNDPDFSLEQREVKSQAILSDESDLSPVIREVAQELHS